MITASCFFRQWYRFFIMITSIEHVITFGKYKGQSVRDIYKGHLSYFEWMQSQGIVKIDVKLLSKYKREAERYQEARNKVFKESFESPSSNRQGCEQWDERPCMSDFINQ